MSIFSTIGLSARLLSSAADVAGKLVAKPASVDDGASFKDSLSAADKFMKYQEMSPAQKLRASYLAAHGLTEDDLATLPPEERQKIEELILEDIKRKLGVKEIKQNAS